MRAPPSARERLVDYLARVPRVVDAAERGADLAADGDGGGGLAADRQAPQHARHVVDVLLRARLRRGVERGVGRRVLEDQRQAAEHLLERRVDLALDRRRERVPRAPERARELRAQRVERLGIHGVRHLAVAHQPPHDAGQRPDVALVVVGVEPARVRGERERHVRELSLGVGAHEDGVGVRVAGDEVVASSSGKHPIGPVRFVFHRCVGASAHWLRDGWWGVFK
jgi:hypothetical protein